MIDNNKEQKERIYELMQGDIDLEKFPVKEAAIVKNEFMNGSYCDELYEGVIKSKISICNQLGVDECPEVEIIISNLFLMMRYFSYKMYDYSEHLNKK